MGWFNAKLCVYVSMHVCMYVRTYVCMYIHIDGLNTKYGMFNTNNFL